MNYFIVYYNLFNMILQVTCLYINFQLHIFPMRIISYFVNFVYNYIIYSPLNRFSIISSLLKTIIIINYICMKKSTTIFLSSKYYNNIVNNQKSYILQFYS